MTHTPSLEENLWPAAAADRGEREGGEGTNATCHRGLAVESKNHDVSQGQERWAPIVGHVRAPEETRGPPSQHSRQQQAHYISFPPFLSFS
jgi:hypothetical protein